jgi:hypothetical protein
MPINRRAIIHIGGKKELKNRKVLKLKTRDNQIFKNVGDKKSISFIVDPNAKQKKTKIRNLIDDDSIRKYNIEEKHVNVNKFKYYDEEHMIKKEEEELKAAKQKEVQELKKITENIKQKFSKDKKGKNDRKKIGMGAFLQELKFPMKYYQEIQKEFVEFEKEYFLPPPTNKRNDKEKYNIFRFKLSDDHKLASNANMNLQLSNINKRPKEFLNKWETLNKLSPNDSFIKKIMKKNFKQIIRDIDRNLGTFINNASKGFHTYDFSQRKEQFWKTPFYFYTAQLALFSQYYFLKHTNLDEWFVDFNGGALTRDDPNGKDMREPLKKTIYNAVINGKIKGINHSFIKKFAATKMKIPWENIEHFATYVQSDLTMFIKTIQSTSNINKKEFNIIDAAALNTHIFFKQKLRTFFHNNVDIKDKKYCLKYACKIRTFANFIDPYLFTEFWAFINHKWNRFYDNEDEKWDDTDNPSIDTIKLGQLHMNHQKYSKFNPMQKWIFSEQKKFNVFRGKDEDPFTVTEIISKIEDMESPNAHHEAFLSVSKKTKTDALNYYEKNDQGKNPTHFDDDLTKMSWWYEFVQICISEWSHAPGIVAMEHEFNGTNKDSRMYMKYLYKYGIDGCILFNLIHFKNLRTSINLNNKKHLHNLKDIMDTDKYKETPDVYGNGVEAINMINGTQFLNKSEYWNHIWGNDTKGRLLRALSEGLRNGFYLSGRSPSVPYDLKNSLDVQQAKINANDRQILVIDTPNNPYWNKYLNPLTCNLEETYAKHFDYCIEQIEKQHGSFKNFNEKFDQLFSGSLILYKNGFMDEHRLKEIKKNNPGITIVNKITDIWDTYKDDERIYFPKRDGMDDDVLSRVEGWLGKFENNTLQHALDGIYHIDYDSFMKKANNLLVPFVPVSLLRNKKRNIFSKDFEWKDDHRIIYDSEKTKLLWPRNSGRPFIFINKYKFLYTDGKKVGDKGKLKIGKKIYKTNEIADKIKNATLIGTTKDKKIGKAIPDFWFDREYPFTNKDIITHIKLKTLLDSGYDKYKIIVNDINKKLEEGGIIEPKERELVKPGEEGEKAGEIIVHDEKTPEEEEADAKRLAQIESDRVTAEKLAQIESDRVTAEKLAQTTKEQSEIVQDTAADIAETAKKMDERLHCEEVEQENPKLAFVKKLLTENSKITNEQIIQKFKEYPEYASTKDMAIECIITAAKGWLKNPDDDDKKLPAPAESEDIDDQKEKVLNRLGLKRVPVKPDGDCLFSSLLIMLKDRLGQGTTIATSMYKTQLQKQSDQLRQEIVDYIIGGKRILATAPEGFKPDKNEVTFWHTYGDTILALSNHLDDGGTMYESKEDYEKAMRKEIRSTIERKHINWGSQYEVYAFEEMNKISVEIRTWDGPNNKWKVKYEGNSKYQDKKYTLVLDKNHYEYARKTDTETKTQGGGGNNVYINKCKNHRHKRTRKFRIRFKNVGGWVHLNKPKKKTRRKY